MSPETTSPLPPGSRARVMAVVRALSLDAIMEQLLPVKPEHLQIEQVKGYGRQKGHLEFYEAGHFEGGFLPKVRIEFTVLSSQLEDALAAVSQAARTGRIGDGKIFVHAICETIQGDA
ncbi:MAG: P-II family nitrogen regulator [Planctomycetota bacterium]|nr:P-II family nitrogen regulator [Planctomycetota bacterium]